MPGRGSVESLNQTEATNAAVTLVQACAELRDNLSALAASRAMLDDTSQSLTVSATALALDGVRWSPFFGQVVKLGSPL